MAGAGAEGPGRGGTLRLTWVTDRLAHVLEHSGAGEASGSWTGLACPGHGLPVGSDAGNPALLRLAGQGELADLVWEAPAEFAAEHGQLGMAAVQARLAGKVEEGARLWEQVAGSWSQAWSANSQALKLMQDAGLTRFSPAKPQRWVIASFEHHTSTHGLPHPHIHNIVVAALTTSARR